MNNTNKSVVTMQSIARKINCFALLALVCFALPRAEAVTIRIDFSGVITGNPVYDFPGHPTPTPPVSVGDSFTGTFFYDPSPIFPSIRSVSFRSGEWLGHGGGWPFEPRFIDGSSTTGVDEIWFTADNNREFVYLHLIDPTGHAITTGVPVTTLNSDDWTNGGFSVAYYYGPGLDMYSSVSGIITTQDTGSTSSRTSVATNVPDGFSAGVPDGGATALLIGLSMVGLAVHSISARSPRLKFGRFLK